jgi:thiosulfate dehydrogenase [quinone] large subunit
MLGLLGIGLALILGVGVRMAAVAGVILLALMWLAEFPPAQHTSAGALTMSTNPFVDDHFLDAVVLIVLAETNAGSVWGLGRYVKNGLLR